MKEYHKKQKEAMVIAVVDTLRNLGVSEPEPEPEPETAAVDCPPFLDVCCGTKSPNDVIAAADAADAADEPEPEPEPEPGPEMDLGSRCPGRSQGSLADRQKLGAGFMNCPLTPGTPS